MQPARGEAAVFQGARPARASRPCSRPWARAATRDCGPRGARLSEISRAAGNLDFCMKLSLLKCRKQLQTAWDNTRAKQPSSVGQMQPWSARLQTLRHTQPAILQKGKPSCARDGQRVTQSHQSTAEPGLDSVLPPRAVIFSDQLCSLRAHTREDQLQPAG